VEDAYAITPEEIAEALGGLPEHKIHCSVLGAEAVKNAIDNYRERAAK
jgi:nitrogen fixation NifU-like protein